MNWKNLLPSVFIAASIFVGGVSAQQNSAPAATASKAKANRKQSALPQDEGERAFKQNCSRCHAAPEGFSPSLSGTIVRHMRVRASLSQRDEAALLHFFNP